MDEVVEHGHDYDHYEAIEEKALKELTRTIDEVGERSSEHRNRLVYLKAIKDVKEGLGLEADV